MGEWVQASFMCPLQTRPAELVGLSQAARRDSKEGWRGAEDTLMGLALHGPTAFRARNTTTGLPDRLSAARR